MEAMVLALCILMGFQGKPCPLAGKTQTKHPDVNTRRSVVATHRGAAGDRYTLFGPTLDVAFNARTKSTVNRRPHVSFLHK